MDPDQPKDIDKIFEERTAIDEALDQAVRAALRLHRQAGNPVVIYRDGRAVWVTVEELGLDDGPPTP